MALVVYGAPKLDAAVLLHLETEAFVRAHGHLSTFGGLFTLEASPIDFCSVRGPMSGDWTKCRSRRVSVVLFLARIQTPCLGHDRRGEFLLGGGGQCK